MCLDNPTNGLDSSTALEFVEMMREYTRQSGCATIMSIYQGSDAMVPMFDKVAVINQGHQVFYGKAQEAKPHFEKLGHKCPPTTTITDFLTSMSANKISAPITSREPPPSTTKQLKMAFESSSHYQDTLREALAAKSMPLPPGSFGGNTFELPLWHQIRLCTNRQFRVLVTNYHNWLIEAGCAIVQSIAIGTLFRDQPRETKSFFILACSLFFCALVPSLQAMSEFGNTFATRSLVARQKQYGFYRPMSYALGLVTTDMIWKIVTISYNIPQYFLTGFQYDAGKFFTWFLVLYIENMALSMIFRTVGILSKSMSWAVLPVGVIFNLGVIYTGLYIPPPQMQGWLFWIKYINVSYTPHLYRREATDELIPFEAIILLVGINYCERILQLGVSVQRLRPRPIRSQLRQLYKPGLCGQGRCSWPSECSRFSICPGTIWARRISPMEERRHQYCHFPLLRSLHWGRNGAS
jgi:hypothetical protein